MKKDVLVTFKSSNDYQHAEKDNIVFQTTGTFYDKDGKYYLKYNEQIDDINILNTLKIEDKRVTIMRFGEVNTQITVEEGKKHLNYYETGEGIFLMGIVGDRVNIHLNDKEGSIKLKYGVELNNTYATHNTIDVKFEEL